MIGNDIVDLQEASIQSNWQRKGFLEKQFTEKEQAVILKSENPFAQVWLLWSMKEAAYKCYVQEHQERFFNPKKCGCFSVSTTKGLVSINANKYHTKSIITSNYIYTIASKQEDVKLTNELFFIAEEENQSMVTNKKLLALFSKEVRLQKNEKGVPYLYKKEEKINISFSTSHHGNYGGFVILN